MIWLISGLFAAVIILTFIYHRYPEARGTIVFLGSGAGIAATIVGVTFSYLGLREVASQYALSVEQHKLAVEESKQAVLHSRQEVAFSYMTKFHNLNLAEAASGLKSVDGKPPEEAHRILGANHESRKALRDVFNFFEEMALASELSYADEKTLCSFFEEPVVRYYSKMSGWVDYYRTSTARLGAYEHFQKLFERWRRGCPSN